MQVASDYDQDTNRPRPASELASLPAALDAIGDRWSLLIVAALLEGAGRFGDLQRAVEGIAPNILSARLKKLAEGGLVTAEPYSERPPRFAYELTDAGRALAQPLRLLAGWAARHSESHAAPVHEACGTALEVGWYCPACREPVDDEPEDEVHYA